MFALLIIVPGKITRGMANNTTDIGQQDLEVVLAWNDDELTGNILDIFYFLFIIQSEVAIASFTQLQFTYN